MTELQQTARVHEGGSGNVIVQIVGDSNHVAAGFPHLALTTFHNLRQIKTELDRLSPYARSVPLLGRESELASLHHFCQTPDAVRVRVLTGGGGSGKTRLALELCESLLAQGWAAGFASGRELKRFAAQQNLSDWGWSRPTLVVVSYAATHTLLLADWIAELANRDVQTLHPLRLLLLERSANTDEGWWKAVFAPGSWDEGARRVLLDPVPPVPLWPLATALQAELMRQVRAWAPSQGASVVPDADWQPPSHWGACDPLSLMMAALELNHGGVLGSGGTLDRTDLALRVARREVLRLRELAQAADLDPDLLVHLVACITLLRGMSEADFLLLAESEKSALHRPSGGDAAKLADVLAQALPRTSSGGLGAVQPDLIGEALLLDVWPARKPMQGQDCVLRCYRHMGLMSVAPALIRCAQDFAVPHPRALVWLHALAQAVQSAGLAEAQTLFDLLPIGSVVLQALKLRLALHIQQTVAAQGGGSSDARAAQARALNDLAVMQANAGQSEVALLTARQAVVLYEQLEVEMPEVFRPDLALSLNNFANAHNGLGQKQESLKIIRLAVALYRQLASENRDVFLPGLAGALNNLAVILSELGQIQEAHEIARQVVAMYRQLDKRRPNVFRPDLAMSLHNLANRLSELELKKDALEAARQAVVLYQQLAEHWPDVFRPDLAMSLNSLAVMLSELELKKDALETARQAVKLYRQLAELQLDVFQSELAMSLHNLANRLHEQGLNREAREVARQAVAIRRQLVAQMPNVFFPDLAMSLTVQARCEVDTSPIMAQQLVHEAISHLTPYFIQTPPAYGKVMVTIVKDYFEFSSLAQVEPDLALLIALYRPTGETP